VSPVFGFEFAIESILLSRSEGESIEKLPNSSHPTKLNDARNTYKTHLISLVIFIELNLRVIDINTTGMSGIQPTFRFIFD